MHLLSFAIFESFITPTVNINETEPSQLYQLSSHNDDEDVDIRRVAGPAGHVLAGGVWGLSLQRLLCLPAGDLPLPQRHQPGVLLLPLPQPAHTEVQVGRWL